ncbi:MAG: hypothetical protein ACLQG3_17085 [Terracidiphilus sp.]
MDLTRRELLRTAAALLIEQWAAARAIAGSSRPVTDRKVVLVTCGGMRREDTFADSGIGNIPHLCRDLGPQSVFYPRVYNNGVTSHFNTVASILTGNWQRLDDWGKTPPASPTLFEYLRKALHISQDQAWLISSNKALTRQIGASSVSGYGPQFGANVVFPKQLLISAVVHAASAGRAVHSTDRTTVQPEIEAILNSDNYDGLGWSVSGDSSSLDLLTLGTMQQAVDDLVRTSYPVTGDEFTYLVTVEVMKRFAPSLLVITFSDMEVAHFGSYSLHLAGIGAVDRLLYELWDQLQTLPAYRGKTTLIILPEFGRDFDGSNSNGFFNHRQDGDSTRITWMMCLGDAVRRAQIIEDPIEQTAICPTIAGLFELKKLDLAGKPLPGLWL